MNSQKPKKERLDKLLVDRGFSESRTQAQSLILAGSVLVEGQVADKPGILYPESVTIELKERLKYVSRGGLKLEKALAEFHLDVAGRVCMDVGASTGGFTDCLLQYGASHVHAVDVGYGQLDWRLRQNPRVTVREKTHILTLDPAELIPPPDLATIDVSFISLKKVLPKVAQCLAVSGSSRQDMVALIKPQFEYRDYCAPKGFKGVVTDPHDLVVILTSVTRDLLDLLPEWGLMGLVESPIQGPKGNREFLLHLQRGESTASQGFPEDFEAQVKALVVTDS